MEVTDMILDIDKLVINNKLSAVTLRIISPKTREMILNFVEKEYESFLKYYESPKVGTEVYAILYNNQMVGTVLIEKQPSAAVTKTDGAIACLVIAKHMRDKMFGSAAIVAACLELQSQGYQRVIAEWVASMNLYRRLGFRVWRTREISSE
jgi:ribosomal protein S18 acetylase RimI-like enzyme